MLTVFPAPIFAIPEAADSVRDWIVWGAAIVGGLTAIAIGIYKIAKWARTAAAAGVFDLLEPKFDEIEHKIDAMKEANGVQHATVGAAIATLADELHKDREGFATHLEESAVATEQLRIVAEAVNLHIAALREEITSPGLPVTPGPLNQGPPPGRRMMF